MRKINNIDEFKNTITNDVLAILNDLHNTEPLNLVGITEFNTAIVNVDIINGFCKAGALYSDRVKDNLSEAIRVNEEFRKFKKVFFVDSHTEESLEFKAYPQHCIKDTDEAEIIDELKSFLDSNAIVCPKNSTNGFFAPKYAEWLEDNKGIRNYIIIGYVTDICCMQYALTQKAYMNENNIDGRVIVLVNGVETFHIDETNHNGDLMNMFGLYNMKINGIELARI